MNANKLGNITDLGSLLFSNERASLDAYRPKVQQCKADFLAAEHHLAAWMDRNREHQAEPQERLIESALPCNLGGSLQVAKWMYQQTEKSNGQVWVMEKVLKHLDPSWVKCFAAWGNLQ